MGTKLFPGGVETLLQCKAYLCKPCVRTVEKLIRLRPVRRGGVGGGGGWDSMGFGRTPLFRAYSPTSRILLAQAVYSAAAAASRLAWN